MKRFPLPVALTVLLAATAVLFWKGGDRIAVPPDALKTPVSTAVAESEPENQVRLARMAARLAVSRELLARRLTVAEAGAVFGWLDEQPPQVRPCELKNIRNVLLRNEEVPWHYVDRATDRGEWLSLRAVDYAMSVAREEFPESADRLAEELDAELEQRWTTGEFKSLPEVNEPACRALLQRSIAAVEAFMRLGPVPAIPASDLRLVARG
jgi:hypothetical protein